ncbi:hypothetical protein [Leucothrix pacifica]|uniref:MORN motif-containing protein n=1 Tax=Leucothrix pacifica TaxID=1247513 RepID=A0A317CD59_9GAMM|nr:hypothetical protein DKW60_17480 [Leucothrix pacifica]
MHGKGHQTAKQYVYTGTFNNNQEHGQGTIILASGGQFIG